MLNYFDLISLFNTMYKEHWSYEWGSAEKGCVDCSGAFVYAYKQLGGPKIYHGSNTIRRKWIGAVTDTPKAGYAAFKVRKDGKEPTQYLNDGIGNCYHIGLVAEDCKSVLNAKSKSSGFCKDSIQGWAYFAPLKDVDYMEVKSMLAYANIDRLRIRDSPNGATVGWLDSGDPVTVIDVFEEWVHTDKGYVMKKYLDGINKCCYTTLINTDKVEITLKGDWEVCRKS